MLVREVRRCSVTADPMTEVAVDAVCCRCGRHWPAGTTLRVTALGWRCLADCGIDAGVTT